MSDLSLLPSNAVAINGTRPVTTSLVIADVFGKRHDNVLRDIETLECSDTFRLLNFEERNRELVTGKNTVQEYRYFDITKDGFVFLVMGYRGPKAAQFKEAYISRFNELEDGLRSPTIPALPALITVAQQGELATHSRFARQVADLKPSLRSPAMSTSIPNAIAPISHHSREIHHA